MTDSYLETTGEQLRAFAEKSIDGPVVMLNLLRFSPDGGAERYAEYMKAAGPFLEKVGGTVRYLGRAQATIIGGEDWDEILLVEYPSKQAFLDMIGDPAYPAAQRRAALVDSRLVCTTPMPVSS